MKMKKFPKIMSEKLNCKIKEVVIRNQEDIDDFNKCIGYRKARVKRYGKTASERIREKNNKIS